MAPVAPGHTTSDPRGSPAPPGDHLSGYHHLSPPQFGRRVAPCRVGTESVSEGGTVNSPVRKSGVYLPRWPYVTVAPSQTLPFRQAARLELLEQVQQPVRFPRLVAHRLRKRDQDPRLL
jgi:hypothetical protein